MTVNNGGFNMYTSNVSGQIQQCEQMVQQLIQQTQQSTQMYRQMIQQEQQNSAQLEQLAQRERQAVQMLESAIQGHSTAMQMMQQVSSICRQLEQSVQMGSIGTGGFYGAGNQYGSYSGTQRSYQ
jgi:dsDNA-specific endonuclease/ATPase MutS2